MDIASLIHKQVESFILDQEDLDNPVLKTTSEIFLSSTTEGADLRTVDPETQARLEALLEAAGTLFCVFSFSSLVKSRLLYRVIQDYPQIILYKI